jgi:membrane protease YdiL (CAAX protease family)
VFGWPRVEARRAQRDAIAADRRPSGWEIVLVLLLFPALAFVTAVGSLLQLAFHAPTDASYVHDLLPGHPWPSALVATCATLVDFGPPLLAVYLLRLSGGGATAIGLDASSPRSDLARCLKLMLLAYVPGFFLEAVISSLAGQHNEVAQAIPPHAAYLLPLLVSAVGAGVVEEVVVLGYLVHRLEQRGWSPARIVLAATLVRASYHLYYGWGTIGIAVWGAVSVVLYRRRRRLLTFVVLHVLWDGWQFIDIYAHGGAAAIAPLAALAILVGCWLAGRRPAVGEMVAP